MQSGPASSSYLRNFFTITAATFALMACKRPTPEDIGPNPSATDTNDTGPIEPQTTTAEPTTGGEQFWNGCLRFPEEGFTGTRHQCGGSGTAWIRFNVVDTLGFNGPYEFDIDIDFGQGEADDSYQTPKVMACCNPDFDEEEYMVYQPHYLSCYHDLAETACRSIWSRMDKVAEDINLIVKPQAKSIAKWLAENQQECYNQLWALSGAESHTPASAIDFFELNRVWYLPGATYTLNIKDIEIEILDGTIDDIFVPPSSGDQIECASQLENNPYTFIVADPSLGTVIPLEEGDGELVGPIPPGFTPYEGASDFTSTVLGSDYTSLLSTAPSEVGQWFYAMQFDGASSVVVSNGTNSTTVDNIRIALYEPTHASYVGSNDYEIYPGQAFFVVTGSVDGNTFMETAFNAATIQIEENAFVSNGWFVHPITLEYSDDNNDVWTLETGTVYFRL